MTYGASEKPAAMHRETLSGSAGGGSERIAVDKRLNVASLLQWLYIGGHESKFFCHEVTRGNADARSRA